jgi:hypothetical protein
LLRRIVSWFKPPEAAREEFLRTIAERRAARRKPRVRASAEDTARAAAAALPRPGEVPQPVRGACWQYQGGLYPPPNIRCYGPGFDPNSIPGLPGRWVRIS